MVWRRSSAMAEFLSRLAVVFRELPPGLLDTRNLRAMAPTPFVQALR